MRLEDCAVAVPINASGHVATLWKTIRDLDRERGRFSVPEVADRADLDRAGVGRLNTYMARLAHGGHIAEVARKGPEIFYRLATAASAPPQVQHSGALYPFEGSLSVLIPRGEAGAWLAIRKLGKGKREFTAEALFNTAHGAIDTDELADYLARLTRGGFVEMAGVTTLKGGRVTRAYRIIRAQPETPRLARDGSLLAGPIRFARMWRSMKMQTYFTALDLALGASLPELQISEEQAARYANDLAAAGYLQVKERAGAEPLYRLKQTMNTGPCAPEVLRARFVWDPNTCRIVGEPTRIEEVRP